MFTDGLRRILSPHFEIVGTAEDGAAAVTAAERLRPDVVILDISMPVLHGIKAARKLQQLEMPCRIVFCTMHNDPALVREALRAGAAGYVLKNAAGSEMICALREIL